MFRSFVCRELGWAHWTWNSDIHGIRCDMMKYPFGRGRRDIHMLPVFPWNPKSGNNRLWTGKTAHTIGRTDGAFAFSFPRKYGGLSQQDMVRLIQSRLFLTLEERQTATNGEVWAVKVGQPRRGSWGISMPLPSSGRVPFLHHSSSSLAAWSQSEHTSRTPLRAWQRRQGQELDGLFSNICLL